MKSTIEKALQRQKEAEAAKRAAEQTSAKEADGSSAGTELNAQTQESQTSLERAAEKQKDQQAQKAVTNDDAAAADNTGADENNAPLDNSAANVSEQQSPEQEVSEQKAVSGSPADEHNIDDVIASKQAETDKHIDIDVARLEALGFVTLTNARRQINEEYREIKRKLIQNAFGPLSKTLANSNIIMVSSARPSEGKTFTAVNLALSIAAEQDKTVLLVDADVLKPNVLRTLAVPEKKGLMDYLLGESEDISDVIYRTNVPKLRIIPAGSSHHLSTELLASGIMSETVNEFSTRYKDRVVIIDTPPLIGINESAVLASFAGQAVIVVEEGRTKLHDIQHSVERLNPDMAIGFVVNKSITNTETGGYYGYSYYGSDREPA
ncbi:XrtA-associated tyrosine autokinase [Glaciecola siphonariae]|uniref:XrtA-associated tyrosine autokinase n=1 Tax=Glaciecola siphonariae TaxID=521012 RepID=UPI003A8CF822